MYQMYFNLIILNTSCVKLKLKSCQIITSQSFFQYIEKESTGGLAIKGHDLQKKVQTEKKIPVAKNRKYESLPKFDHYCSN